MDYIIESNKDKTSNILNINIKGCLTLVKSNEIKDKLLSLIKKSNEIRIKISEVTDFDLSFIQILYAILKIEDKKIFVAADWNNEELSLIEHAGFFDLLTNKIK